MPAAIFEPALVGLGAPHAADILYVVNGESTYLRMTEDVGLPPDRYAGWLTDTLTAILLRPEPLSPQTTA